MIRSNFIYDIKIQIYSLFIFILQIINFPILILLAIISKKTRKSDPRIGFGPEPINPLHAVAVRSVGLNAKSYVTHLYHTYSNFDYLLTSRNRIRSFFDVAISRSTIFALFKFDILVFYFHGGPYGFPSRILWRLEPILYKFAGIKTVLIPYGGDVQDLKRNSNLLYKNAMSHDYPEHWRMSKIISKKIDFWQAKANFVISGCDWVYYMTYWDELWISHFTIELPKLSEPEQKNQDDIFTILHAPNHKNIKGTSAIEKAIFELKQQGYLVDLVLLENLPNVEIIKAIKRSDLVVDQLVIGWYAQFAIEAMAHGKPVVCYISDELLDLYISCGLLEEDELPIIRASSKNVKSIIESYILNKQKLRETAFLSRKYIESRHSLEVIGNMFKNVFDRIYNVDV